MSGKSRVFALLLAVFLLAAVYGVYRALSPREKIARHPNPGNYCVTLNSIPAYYDPHSSDLWQVDLRSADLTGLDLSDSGDVLSHASFDDKTIWPVTMPSDFDWRHILEMGKNPGLGVRQLHEQGITGKGIGIAIIDQTLLVDHQEYADQLKLYEETWEVPWLDAMSIHGAAVASIAVGKTVGVAPEADLYYFATESCYGRDQTDFACLAKIVRRVLEVNQTLPLDHRIRVLSMSIGWMPGDQGYAEITSAVEEARADGIFVVNTVLEDTYGFELFGLGREPLSDADDPFSYMPADWWADNFYNGAVPPRMLLVPMDSRTIASPTGFSDYVFYRQGGISWSIPYVAGTYALAAQVKPDITPEEFWAAALETGRTIQIMHNGKSYSFGVILDPQALIAALQKQTTKYNFSMDTTPSFSLQPASDFPLVDLADLLTRGFENYFVPIHMDVNALLGMIRRDSVDLTASRFLLADGVPAALALIARRGSASRVAAMGVVSAWRGRGAGSFAMEKLVTEARERAERVMYLEVIDRNEPAIRLYEKYGFVKMRRLTGFSVSAPAGVSANMIEIEIPVAGDLIFHHGYPELPWQVAGGTIALFATPSRAFQLDSAYAVTSALTGEHVTLWSVLTEPSARGKGQACRLLRALFAKYPNKTWHVPAIFPEEMTGFFEKAGFEKEDLGQFQMKLEL